MKLVEIQNQIRSYFAEQAAAREERSRQQRVAHHQHFPGCALTGNIVYSMEVGELSHRIRVSSCTECGSEIRFDESANFANNVGRYGLWH